MTLEEADRFWWSEELRYYLLMLKQFGPKDIQIMRHRDWARVYVGFINGRQIAEGTMQEVTEAMVAYLCLTDEEFRRRFNAYRERARETETKRNDAAASFKRD